MPVAPIALTALATWNPSLLTKWYQRAVGTSRDVASPATSTAALAIIDQLAPALEAHETRTTLQAQFTTDALLYQHLKAPSATVTSGSCAMWRPVHDSG